MNASDTRVVYAPLVSQLPARTCTLKSARARALAQSHEYLKLNGKNAAS